MNEAADPQEIVKKADELRLAGDYKQCIEILEAFSAKNPFVAPAKLCLGRAYFESGKVEHAKQILAEYVEFVPENHLARKILARIYVDQRLYKEAKTQIDPVLAAEPNDTVAKKISEQVSSYFQNELEDGDTVKTTMPTLTPTMAELYYHQGHLKEAREIYEHLLMHDPQNTEYQEKIRMIDHGSTVQAPENPKVAESAPVVQMNTKKSKESNRAPSPTNEMRISMLETLLEAVQSRKKR